ncbi:bifunctional hydroxymethylpyrimidine kinase/phosphomethylpyrimidine kinase [Lactobacillus sp. DCY120]|uniref:pyridoxal kinase n=1 Tax=Bombilactobacillus apium TaxID=2675299 RepID=A0A850QZZ9_9LACO|nr:PfkB family carbohydrate kinase [Bombilactobacillus apium]NVY96369.1 bifunctional hydroxymethylpyrimidine kinase/phosphomethylpyrimidine kinase [Bombilactobacillus apium]
MSKEPPSRPLPSQFLVAEDWSCLGRISLQTATTIFQIWGLPTTYFPVHLLAAHPGWDPNAPQLDLTAWLEETLTYWHNRVFKGAYLGYLGSIAVTHLWQQFLEDCSGLVLLDPAMADHGQLYPGFDEDYVQAQRELLTVADVLTPNLSEAELLLKQSITTDTDLTAALVSLTRQIRGDKVIITSVHEGQQIGCAYLEHQQLRKVLHPRNPHNFTGTGDLFSSLLACLLFSGWQWQQAIVQATALTAEAVNLTPATAVDVDLTAIIPRFWRLKEVRESD